MLTWLRWTELSIRADLIRKLVPVQFREKLRSVEGIEVERFVGIDLRKHVLLLD